MKSTVFVIATIGAMASFSTAGQAQDTAAGMAQFKQRCQMCHTATPGARGVAAPNLYGVVNRVAASTQFNYSAALKASKKIWSTAQLDEFLAAPNKVVPGTRMIVSTVDPKQRANLIAYLATLRAGK